jgi:hypothetical protein
MWRPRQPWADISKSQIENDCITEIRPSEMISILHGLPDSYCVCTCIYIGAEVYLRKKRQSRRIKRLQRTKGRSKRLFRVSKRCRMYARTRKDSSRCIRLILSEFNLIVMQACELFIVIECLNISPRREITPILCHSRVKRHLCAWDDTTSMD